MNKYLKYAAAAIFVATLAINIAITLDDPFVLLSSAMAETTTTTTTGTGWCALSQGQHIYNTNCFVWGISSGVNVWYFQFDTATCDETCNPGGSNCCYDLKPIL